MSLSTEFEQSFSARLNSGLQLLDDRLSETLDTSVGMCRGHWLSADYLLKDKMLQQASLIEGGLSSATNASQYFTSFPFALITRSRPSWLRSSP